MNIEHFRIGVAQLYYSKCVLFNPQTVNQEPWPSCLEILCAISFQMGIKIFFQLIIPCRILRELYRGFIYYVQGSTLDKVFETNKIIPKIKHSTKMLQKSSSVPNTCVLLIAIFFFLHFCARVWLRFVMLTSR